MTRSNLPRDLDAVLCRSHRRCGARAGAVRPCADRFHESFGEADDAELEAGPSSTAGFAPRVTLTLPPPMSITTTTSPGTLTPYTAAR